MLEVSEVGNAIGKAEYKAAIPELRVGLINAQYDLRDANFPVVIWIAGDDRLAAETRVRRQVPRGVEAVGLVFLHLAQVLLTRADDDVAGGAGTAAAAGVFELHAEVLGNVQQRLGLPVMGVFKRAVFELDGLRFPVDDESDFGHGSGSVR